MLVGECGELECICDEDICGWEVVECLLVVLEIVE